MEWQGIFPATVNDESCVELAYQNDFNIVERWFEDFAHFTIKYPGTMFGVGLKHPSLHNPDYDFPDHIIESTITSSDGIIRNVLKTWK